MSWFSGMVDALKVVGSARCVRAAPIPNFESNAHATKQPPRANASFVACRQQEGDLQGAVSKAQEQISTVAENVKDTIKEVGEAMDISCPRVNRMMANCLESLPLAHLATENGGG